MVDFWAFSDGTIVRAIGGGKGGGGGGQQTTTSTSSSEPWAKQQPYLLTGFEEAKQLYEGDKPQYFPGSTVVPYSPESEEALGLRTGIARDPSSLIGQAGGQVGRTLSGDYLRPGNEVFDAMLQGVTSAVRPGIDTGFAGAGRFGSPLHAEALGRGISTGMMPYIEGERGRQFGAVQQAYPVSQYGADILGGVGAAREGKSREELQEEIDRYNFGQTVEQAKLREYMATISPQYGQQATSTVSQPTYRDPLMQGLGAAGSLAGIGSALFGPVGGGGIFGK